VGGRFFSNLPKNFNPEKDSQFVQKFNVNKLQVPQEVPHWLWYGKTWPVIRKTKRTCKYDHAAHDSPNRNSQSSVRLVTNGSRALDALVEFLEPVEKEEFRRSSN
jgi:predicted methyltransferase